MSRDEREEVEKTTMNRSRIGLATLSLNSCEGSGLAPAKGLEEALKLCSRGKANRDHRRETRASLVGASVSCDDEEIENK